MNEVIQQANIASASGTGLIIAVTCIIFLILAIVFGGNIREALTTTTISPPQFLSRRDSVEVSPSSQIVEPVKVAPQVTETARLIPSTSPTPEIILTTKKSPERDVTTKKEGFPAEESSEATISSKQKEYGKKPVAQKVRAWHHSLVHHAKISGQDDNFESYRAAIIEDRLGAMAQEAFNSYSDFLVKKQGEVGHKDIDAMIDYLKATDQRKKDPATKPAHDSLIQQRVPVIRPTVTQLTADQIAFKELNGGKKLLAWKQSLTPEQQLNYRVALQYDPNGETAKEAIESFDRFMMVAQGETFKETKNFLTERFADETRLNDYRAAMALKRLHRQKPISYARLESELRKESPDLANLPSEMNELKAAAFREIEWPSNPNDQSMINALQMGLLSIDMEGGLPATPMTSRRIDSVMAAILEYRAEQPSMEQSMRVEFTIGNPNAMRISTQLMAISQKLKNKGESIGLDTLMQTIAEAYRDLDRQQAATTTTPPIPSETSTDPLEAVIAALRKMQTENPKEATDLLSALRDKECTHEYVTKEIILLRKLLGNSIDKELPNATLYELLKQANNRLAIEEPNPKPPAE